MWTRKEYEDAAQKIGEDFVAQGGTTSINDLSMKVAQDGGLNPEGIRTLVRLANVAAFEQNFEKRSRDGHGDRMVEFTVGDPEVVISQLHDGIKEAQVKAAAEAQYDRTADYFADVKYDKPPLEKVAETRIETGVEAAKTPTMSNAEIRLLFKKAEDKMKQELHRTQLRWENNICKAASILLANDSRVEARTELEKIAVSLCGEDILPELRLLQIITSPRRTEINLCGGEKIATVINTYVATPSKPQKAILKLLKEANIARKESHIKEAGLQWLAQNKTRVEK